MDRGCYSPTLCRGVFNRMQIIVRTCARAFFARVRVCVGEWIFLFMTKYGQTIKTRRARQGVAPPQFLRCRTSFGTICHYLLS